MNKKRIISPVVFLAVLSMLLSILTGCATSEKIPIPTVQEDVYIYDDDNIIDDDIENELNQMLVQLEEKTGAEFAIVSVESLLGRSIEEYSNNIFNTLGIGKKDKDNGVLLLFSRSDSKVRLEIGRGLEGCLNDSKCGRILDDYFVPYRELDEYTEATKLTVNAVLSIIAEEYEIDIEGLEKNLAEENDSEESPDDSPFIRILLLILLAVIILGLIFGGSSGSSSGGYWGGSSGSSSGGYWGGSSGGFSGGGSFGGGFSGGGGASR